MRAVILFIILSIAGLSELHAQFFNFGKNRVQYEDFQWRYIQTDHFDVLYYSKYNYKLGEFSGEVMETAYKQISEDFQHEIAERITVIIYDSDVDFAQTNVIPLPEDSQGILGVTDLYKNRVTVWFTGNYASFKHTLHHELVHAVINDMFYGGSIQAIVQNNVQLAIPLWFNEGMAEYSSMGYDTETDNFIRDAVVNNYLPPIPYLNGYFAYRGGQSVWNFIVETYGRQKIAEIFQSIKASRSIEIGFRRSLGLSLEELSDRWQDYLKKRYYPEIANRELLREISTQLTSYEKTGYYNTSPAISPQGDKVAMISNSRGYFDLVVISAIDGKKLKTLIKGDNNVNFESLNILNPNITWSPDGRKIALATRQAGQDQLSIVDYRSRKVEQIRFPNVDGILTVSWAPDGRKIAFSGTIGPYSDIFVYDLETGKAVNLTNDLFSDLEPAWAFDSQTIYFSSDRGPELELGAYRDNYKMLLNPHLYQRDLYSLKMGESKVQRLTNTPDWTESRPQITGTGRLLFISDQNGIPNVFEFDLKNRSSYPLTDLISGVQQMSISPDGTKLIMNNFFEGALHVFLIRAPFDRRKDEPLRDNLWAKRRQRETEFERVPAVRYAYEMYAPNELVAKVLGPGALVEEVDLKEATPFEDSDDPNIVDFRNYVFGEDLDEEAERLVEDDMFEPVDNQTEDGRYKPKQYRLKFSSDFRYFNGVLDTQFGAFGFSQLFFSDVLGNHQISFTTNLVFDLRNSNYALTYGNFTHRTNYLFSWYHQAFQIPTLFLDQETGQLNQQLVRFRIFGGGATAEYPVDKFTRWNVGLNVIGISRDLSEFGSGYQENENSSFLQPTITYIKDRSRPGFLTPSGGHRYAISLSASPPISQETARFASVIGDFRKYFGVLGSPYSLAVRFSGGASFFRDEQTFILGGMMNWINQQWEGGQVDIDRLSDLFLTLPALPMRGYLFNTLFGNYFGLTNIEFRFPLVAALLPGPIPILPLYNLTGLFFIDAGIAWGLDVGVNDDPRFSNPASLDFSISSARIVYIGSSGNIYEESELNDPNNPIDDRIVGEEVVREGDILIGMGYGLRTILLGLPFRFDVGFPFDGRSFGSPVYYFTLGVDF